MEDQNKSKVVIVTGFLGLYLIFKSDWLLYTSFATGLIFTLTETLGNLVIKGWFKLGHILGWINTRILLSVVFFIFLLPMAWLYRLTRKNPLQLKNKGQKSFYTVTNKTFTKLDLQNPW